MPVPHVYAFCADESVIGTSFYVTEYVEGRMFWAARLPGLSPTKRANFFDAMNAILAQLHRIDHCAVGLGDFGRPGNYFDRQIERWARQYSIFHGIKGLLVRGTASSAHASERAAALPELIDLVWAQVSETFV